MSMLRRMLMADAMFDTPIRFEDAEVKRICVENFGGVNGITNKAYGTVGVRGVEGELTYRQALAVGNVMQLFRGNTDVERFNEFKWFKSVVRLGDNAFDGCTALTALAIPDSVNSVRLYTLRQTKIDYLKFKNVTNVYSSFRSSFIKKILMGGLLELKLSPHLNLGTNGQMILFPDLETIADTGGSNVALDGTKAKYRFEKIRYVGVWAIQHCEYVIFDMSTPPQIDATNRLEKVYVPDEYVAAYRSAETFSTFNVLPLSQLSTDYPADVPEWEEMLNDCKN